MAKRRLAGRDNVLLRQLDFLKAHELDKDYDFVISQRFLINLPDWVLQQEVLLDLMSRLKPGGKLLMLEGSQQENDALNEFRAAVGLKPILERWHNVFFDDDLLIGFMQRNNFSLVEQDGLGAYFVLTRGVRPMLDTVLNWDCDFNRLAAIPVIAERLGFKERFSRLKLFVFAK